MHYVSHNANFPDAGEGVAIEEQLELIFRWIVIVLCSKEHTVGLQALLSSLNDLFVYLHDIKYELSDNEAILLVPFVLEKASLAKVKRLIEYFNLKKFLAFPHGRAHLSFSLKAL